MVSFWPWKGDDVSPASFERTLSTLATKIANTQASLEHTRSTSRRVRVLITLYLLFGYLVYAIVLALVVGWQKMVAWEWALLVGGPIVIYGLRTLLNAYFNYRLETLTTKLKEQQNERAKTIQKLKDATRYDSTLQLLEKYGGSEAKSSPHNVGKKGDAAAGLHGAKQGRGDTGGRPATPSRTNLQPPATANIRQQGARIPSAGQGPFAGDVSLTDGDSLRLGADSPAANAGLDVTAEFAPNAFGSQRALPPAQLPGGQYVTAGALQAAYGANESHWYDRILDLLLGEDETAAKNRIVLICSACRLVNGQAPPGTASLAEVGSWRCMGCSAMNGEDAEAKKIVSDVLKKSVTRVPSSSEGDNESIGEAGSPVLVKKTDRSGSGVRKREKRYAADED